MSIQIMKSLLSQGKTGDEILTILNAITPNEEPKLPVIEPFVDVVELGCPTDW
jgi:hypothetical protein